MPKWKWEHISIDFMLGLPRPPSEKYVIWVTMDRLTKSIHFLPIRKGTPRDKLAKVYVKWYCTEFQWLLSPIEILNLCLNYGITYIKLWGQFWILIQPSTHKLTGNQKEQYIYQKMCCDHAWWILKAYRMTIFFLRNLLTITNIRPVYKWHLMKRYAEERAYLQAIGWCERKKNVGTQNAMRARGKS